MRHALRRIAIKNVKFVQGCPFLPRADTALVCVCFGLFSSSYISFSFSCFKFFPELVLVICRRVEEIHFGHSEFEISREQSC